MLSTDQLGVLEVLCPVCQGSHRGDSIDPNLGDLGQVRACTTCHGMGLVCRTCLGFQWLRDARAPLGQASLYPCLDCLSDARKAQVIGQYLKMVLESCAVAP